MTCGYTHLPYLKSRLSRYSPRNALSTCSSLPLPLLPLPLLRLPLPLRLTGLAARTYNRKVISHRTRLADLPAILILEETVIAVGDHGGGYEAATAGVDNFIHQSAHCEFGGMLLGDQCDGV